MTKKHLSFPKRRSKLAVRYCFATFSYLQVCGICERFVNELLETHFQQRRTAAAQDGQQRGHSDEAAAAQDGQQRRMGSSAGTRMRRRQRRMGSSAGTQMRRQQPRWCWRSPAAHTFCPRRGGFVRSLALNGEPSVL